MKYSRVPVSSDGHLIDIAAQDRREVGVHHRGVAARHQAQQRADGMAGGDLGETGFAREVREALLVSGIFPGVHQHDGAGAMPSARASARMARACGFVERFDLGAVDADAAADLLDAFVEHRRQGDREVEQPRAGLVADAQRVGETAVDQQQGAVALALQQRVGGNGRAHLHRVDQAGAGSAASAAMPRIDLMPAMAASL